MVIVGAGEVGWYLAERLGAEHHDVVVVEQDEGTAAAIGEALDIQVVVGNGCHPSVLQEAGVERAALVAGVTQNDEVNLLASLLAKEHRVPKTVVRIQTEELRGPAGRGILERVGADVVIDPDADTAEEILELGHLSGADEVYPMARSARRSSRTGSCCSGRSRAGVRRPSPAATRSSRWATTSGCSPRGRPVGRPSSSSGPSAAGSGG